MFLKEVIEIINKNFRQEEILLPEYDYYKKEFVKRFNPKFLYRGENNFYSETKSNYHRFLEANTFDKNQLSTIQDLILKQLGINYLADKHFNFFSNLKSLSIMYEGNLLYRNDPIYKNMIVEIQCYLHHYGFPTMWIDFTSDLNIAAFFGVYKNINNKGKICVIELKSLLEKDEIKKLNTSSAKRPNLQKAFALRMYDNRPDIKNLSDFKSEWFEFELNLEDKIAFEKYSLLNTKNDPISESIIDFLKKTKIHDKKIEDYFLKIKNELIELKK